MGRNIVIIKELLTVLCVGACMKNLNVTMGDSRDREGRNRFFPFHPQNHIIPSKI